MKIIDPRDGRVVKIGDVVDRSADVLDLVVDPQSGVRSLRPGGRDVETWTVLEVKPGFFRASARVRVRAGDVTTESWVPLIVRWLHPHFIGQHVGFLPS